MDKILHKVSFWEKDINENLIPCCESSPLTTTTTTNGYHDKQQDGVVAVNKKDSTTATTKQVKEYYYVELKDHVEQPKDARNCRRLLKYHYKWYLKKRSTPSLTTQQTELNDFFYYHVTFEPTQLSKNADVRKWNYSFHRQRIFCAMTPSCYISDDYGIMLFKYDMNILRYCYLDVKNNSYTYHQKFCLSNHPLFAFICNGSIWIVHQPFARKLEVMFLRPCDDIRVTMKIPFSRGESSTSKNLIDRIRISKSCFLITDHNSYLVYKSEEKMLVSKTFKFDSVVSMGETFLLGDHIIMIEKYEKGVPPVLYIGLSEPEIKIQKKLDLELCLNNCKQYIPYGYGVKVFFRGMKVLIHSEESYIIVVDILKCTITQILSYVPCFWQHKLSIHISVDGQYVRLIGKSKQIYKPGYFEYLCTNFPIWHGSTLKDMCIHTISKHYTLQQIEQFHLPQTLLLQLRSVYVNNCSLLRISPF